MEPNFFMHIPLLAIVVPMSISVLFPLIHNAKACRWISLGIYAFTIIISVLLINYLNTVPNGYFSYMAGRFPAPWGNELRAGNLEAVMALGFSVVMFLSVWGSYENTYKLQNHHKSYIHYTMLNFLFASMMALIFTNDLFTSYVFIEINTLTACGIMILDNNGSSLGATMKYLFMSMLGSGLYLIAIIYLYSVTGHLLMVPLKESITMLIATGQYTVPLVTAMAMFGLAIAFKAGLFPFHAWFPDSYNYSPHGSSALLSGLVSKAYIFIFIKIIFRVFGVEAFGSMGLQPILLALGSVAMLIGSVYAFMQKDLKKMVSFSSVAQIGYIFVGIGLNTYLGYAAALFHILFHAATKSMLFISTGNMVEAAGSSKIEDMSGIGYKRPISAIAFWVGGLSMIGIPLFMGFISKLNFASAAFQANYIYVLVFLGLSTCLNVLYFIPPMMKMFSKKHIGSDFKPAIESFNTALPLIAFMAVNVIFGLFQSQLMNLITTGLMTLG